MRTQTMIGKYRLSVPQSELYGCCRSIGRNAPLYSSGKHSYQLADSRSNMTTLADAVSAPSSMTTIKKGFAVFGGPGDKNKQHMLPAYQIILGLDRDVTVVDPNGRSHKSRAIIIKPLVPHLVRRTGQIIVIFIAPESNLAWSKQKDGSLGDIEELDVKKLPFEIGSSRSEIVKAYENLIESPRPSMDPRLQTALRLLDTNLQNFSIAEVASRAGLSNSRLRTLARKELGLPLSTWVMWRKMVEGNKALSDGLTLSEAAVVGGFSDQAHFCRTMQRMCGLTPKSARRIF